LDGLGWRGGGVGIGLVVVFVVITLVMAAFRRGAGE
jgi:hypothetical protein